MSWMKELYETYENCSNMVGIEDNDGIILLPVAHSTQNAQIEIIINLKGKFLRAKELPKADAITIIPVTGDSGTRSSGIAPHPLCDKLCYVAGDYVKYCDKKNARDYYNAYLSNLEKWCTSKHHHDKVIAVFNYVKKGSMIIDLLSCGAISLDSTGYLDKKKIHNIASSDLFVRFRIEDFNLIGEGAVWKDRSIYQSFIDYILSNQEKTDLCYISGETVPCSYKHPAKVRHAADKAKLISANDESGFTYRGRFIEKEQALSVGYLTSQKAHNALRWLIEKQGYTHNGIFLVVWEKSSKKLPQLLESTRDTFFGDELFEMDSDLGNSYEKRLSQAVDGYKSQLNSEASIHIISLDAATTGRLAVNYYRELNGLDFMERLKFWHETCIWEHEFWKKDKTKGTFIGAPKAEDIVLAAFGVEQNGRLTVRDGLMKATIERLLPCILDKRNIPRDIVRAAVQNASRPTVMEFGNWEKVLTVTCALVKKDQNYMGVDINMALDQEKKDRSYLYGRLLAVADRIEYVTYEKGKNRQTIAKRYMQQFKNRPYTTWSVIESHIIPYFNKLKSIEQYTKYEHLLDELHDMIDINDYINNSPLDGMYLLGYHCQLKAFYN